MSDSFYSTLYSSIDLVKFIVLFCLRINLRIKINCLQIYKTFLINLISYLCFSAITCNDGATVEN